MAERLDACIEDRRDPAAAATDRLASNNHYSYCRLNTQYMLFPRE
jgi:hypothetical protein